MAWSSLPFVSHSNSSTCLDKIQLGHWKSVQYIRYNQIILAFLVDS